MKSSALIAEDAQKRHELAPLAPLLSTSLDTQNHRNDFEIQYHKANAINNPVVPDHAAKLKPLGSYTITVAACCGKHYGEAVCSSVRAFPCRSAAATFRYFHRGGNGREMANREMGLPRLDTSLGFPTQKKSKFTCGLRLQWDVRQRYCVDHPAALSTGCELKASITEGGWADPWFTEGLPRAPYR